MNEMKYNVAVIGGGPGGYSAALEAVKYGLTVVLFEKDELGGVCLNKGCVPTKFLLHSGEVYRSLRRTSAYGISTGEPILDFNVTQHENYRIVAELRERLRELLSENKITVISADAAIVSENTVRAGDEIFTAENIIIATGSVPSVPFVEGAVTSDELLKTAYVPESLTIIGGGIVAVEFAGIFSSLGSRVNIKVRGERLLRKMDRELAAGAAQILKKLGVKLQTKCSQDEFACNDSQMVLSAVGRIPQLPDMGNLSITLGEDGSIIADDIGQTSVKGVYAVGDVVSGSSQLAHTAMEQGRRAVGHIVGSVSDKPSVIISCIYLQPEIASAGLSETQAKAAGIDCVSAKQTMYSNARTLIANPERGFVKIVAERSSGKIIGAQLICERAGDIITELALAMNTGLTAEELCRTVHPHPSFCEAVYEAAELLKSKLSRNNYQI